MDEHKQLIVETKESIQEYVPKLIEACDTIGEMLQSNDAGWSDYMNQFFEGVNWTIDAISGIRDIDQNEFTNAPVGELLIITPHLAEALEIRDFVAAADIFQFEIKRILEDLLNAA